MIASEFIAYLLKSGLIIGVLFGLYFILFKRDTFHSLNRFVLLGILVIGSVIPFISLPEQTEYLMNINQFSFTEEMRILTPAPYDSVYESLTHEIAKEVKYVLLIYLYTTVILILLFKVLNDIFKITRLLRKGKMERSGKFKIIYLPEIQHSFSFINTIFLNPNQSAYERERIIQHEKAHIQLLHTIDLLIVELFVLLHWFNPFIYLIRRSIKEVHEFQTDEKVKGSGDDFIAYQQLLLRQVELKRIPSLASSFNSITLKRFKMMNKKRSSKMKLLTITLFIPVLVFLTMSFGNKLTEPFSDLAPDLISDTIPATISIDKAKAKQNSETNIKKIDLYAQESSDNKDAETLIHVDDFKNVFLYLHDTLVSISDFGDAISNIYDGLAITFGDNPWSVSEEGLVVFYEDMEFHTEEAKIYPNENKMILINMSAMIKSSSKNPPCIFPVKDGDGVRIASGFGKRIHPIYKIEKMHNGIDISAPLGTEVMASADGMVREVVTDKKGYGKYIIIDHDAVYSTLYAQLDTQLVVKGDKVKRGDVIGKVGNSGLSTAPHLHYEIKKNGKYVDPADYIPARQKH